ncbi:dihydroorotate dehydrogenase [Oscillospiraceae bacterium HV4-5-C5C]|nr:dihydroorotate dehydrogenase [Oscillospiraceae bacterium HV4-5-C5C]
MSLSVDLSVQVGPSRLKNPVVAASGTFGFGREAQAFMDLKRLGGISAKAVTVEPRLGNLPPRTAETASGLLNSVGLQNPGLQHYLAHELPFMQSAGFFIVQNIAGDTVEDYVQLAEALDQTAVQVIELNLSCPNVKHGLSFGAKPPLIREVTAAVRKVTTKPLWVKLTPNVTSIAEAAQAAREGGADAVSLINTLLGLAIDWRSRRPILHNNTGGLSGPAVKPVALRMVNEVYRTVDLPIVGMGGIMTAEDVLEFMLAGASCVQVGTANLLHPQAMPQIIRDLERLCQEQGIARLSQLVGQLQLW